VLRDHGRIAATVLLAGRARLIKVAALPAAMVAAPCDALLVDGDSEASVLSMPAMVALNRYVARPQAGSKTEPSCRQSILTTPSRVIRSFSAKISSTAARSPT